MATTSEQGQFSAHDKVVLTEDVPGVPAGPKGKVMLRTGFSWIRYRVRFDNDVEVAWLEDHQLTDPKSFTKDYEVRPEAAS